MPENKNQNVFTLPDGRRFTVNADGSVTMLDNMPQKESAPEKENAPKEEMDIEKSGDAFKKAKEKFLAKFGKTKFSMEQLAEMMRANENE